MPLISFNDILSKINICPNDVLLIRHPLNNKGFKACFDANMVYEYTCHQKNNFGTNYNYWAVFIGDNGSNAFFYGLYENKGSQPDIIKRKPKGMPDSEKYNGTMSVYNLKKMSELSEYENRLVIDWGNSTRSWYQRGVNEKQVVAIRDVSTKPFVSYESVIINYSDLQEIIENPLVYSEWKTALSSIYAIYLIVDRTDGKQYVGSATGKDGLFGRWTDYVETKHGNNKEMEDLICYYPKRYKNFQFSILQVLPTTLSKREVDIIETRYKNKLLTKQFGLNGN